MFSTPILLIIFKRPNTTARVFDLIRQVRPTKIYISSDAPRPNREDEISKCAQARLITENIDWPCEVKRLYHNVNLGCGLGPRAAFNWFFSHEKEGIILEDDCLPHPDFFIFAQTMLDRYRYDKRIISVNGSNLGYCLYNGNSYTFSRFMNMWGWATWSDRVNSIDYSLQEWRKIKNPLWFLYTRLRQNIFDTDINWYRYWKHKFDLSVSHGEISWWDWQWVFHQLLNRQYSIVPSVNLVSNIGFGEEATHTFVADNPASDLPVNTMKFPLRHPKTIAPDFKYEEKHVKWVWCFHLRQNLNIAVKLKKYFKRKLEYLSYLNINTVRFNLYYFNFRTALKLPVLLSRNVYIKKLAGKIILPNNISFGIIKIGYGDVGIFDNKKSRSIWENRGLVYFKGIANLGHGTKVSVLTNAKLYLGENFNVTAESSIISNKEIEIGSNTLISWNCLIMDTDFHKIYDLEIQHFNFDSKISIGDNVWIGSQVTILKGVRIPNGCVIGARSVVTTTLPIPNAIYAGHPALLIKEIYKWEI